MTLEKALLRVEMRTEAAMRLAAINAPVICMETQRELIRNAMGDLDQVLRERSV